MNPARKVRLRGSDSTSYLLILFACLLCSFPALTLPQKLGDFGEDGQSTVLDLVRLINHINGRNRLPRVPDVVSHYGGLLAIAHPDDTLAIIRIHERVGRLYTVHNASDSRALDHINSQTTVLVGSSTLKFLALK